MDLRAWAARAWPGHGWARASAAHGAFHEVAVLDGVVARVATGATARARTEREAATLRTVADLALPFDVPELVGEPVHLDGSSGLLCTRVAGEARPDAPWEEVRDGLAAVVRTLRAVVPEDHPGSALPAVREWCGAADWTEVVRRDLAPRLPAPVAVTSVEVADRVLAQESDVAPTLVHGDLNLHNLMWSDSCPTGLIDLDHAAWADPAVDVAPLIGTFGVNRVSEIVEDDELLARAMHHRASLPLQVAAAAHLVGDARLRDHALGNFVGRAGSGTLHSPDGRAPEG